MPANDAENVKTPNTPKLCVFQTSDPHHKRDGKMIKQAFLPALFGILFYKILEAPMHTYPYIAEIAGALGGCFMVWFCDRMSFFLRKKKI